MSSKDCFVTVLLLPDFAKTSWIVLHLIMMGSKISMAKFQDVTKVASSSWRFYFFLDTDCQNNGSSLLMSVAYTWVFTVVTLTWASRSDLFPIRNITYKTTVYIKANKSSVVVVVFFLRKREWITRGKARNSTHVYLVLSSLILHHCHLAPSITLQHKLFTRNATELVISSQIQ